MNKETKLRSLIKGISWRVLATTVTIIIVYVFFGRLDLAIMAGFVETIAKIVLYFFHERMWHRVGFGKRKVKPFSIWFTGLPLSGKTLIANKVYIKLKNEDFLVEKIDRSDIVDLLPNATSSREDRNKHLERVGHLIKILQSNLISTISVFSSPYKESRLNVKNMVMNHVEIYVKTNRQLNELILDKEVKDSTRITEIYKIYEEPKSPNIILNPDVESLEVMSDKIVNYIKLNFVKNY
ncbi:MAG: adenylyl-sulfate kinase [Arcobacter sp.]|uniref:adenylyl-sulfate kinase n=1 Tax=Arcobacter sp. TaxID=1872629 RepID=UPI003AFF9BF7